jgi:hypothetical protein
MDGNGLVTSVKRPSVRVIRRGSHPRAVLILGLDASDRFSAPGRVVVRESA